MKEYLIGSYPCYEFYNIELANKILPLLLTDIHYVSTSPNSVHLQSQAGYKKNNLGNLENFYDNELYDWLKSCLDMVANKHFSKLRLDICDMWVTKTNFSQSSEFHSHPLSVFSGLFYLQDCKNSHTTFMIEDSVYTKWYEFLGEENLVRHKKFFDSPSIAGKLIIWPSELQHKISRHTDKFVRHTLAFNTMFVGQNIAPTKRIIFHKQ